MPKFVVRLVIDLTDDYAHPAEWDWEQELKMEKKDVALRDVIQVEGSAYGDKPLGQNGGSEGDEDDEDDDDDEDEDEEQTYTLWLESYPADRKIGVIKAIREVSGLGLKEAKDLVEGGLPTAVREGISHTSAEDYAATLQAAGAETDITDD